MGAYAQLDKATKFAAQMTVRDLDCADVARRVNAQFGTPTQPQVVSRQMVSKLKTGRTKRCTPLLAERICWALGVATEALFVVHEVPSNVARTAHASAA